jgi:divalent metal cation (Fe/Co/Zn/Cd) transporter
MTKACVVAGCGVAPATQDLQEAMKERRFVVFAAIAANLAIATMKFTVAVLSGSSAMISEGIH